MGLGIQRLLTGLHVPQEYVCIQTPVGIHASIFLKASSGEKNWVTNSFVFVGYKPLIFAVDSSVIENNIGELHELTLHFECQEKIIATLRLKLVSEKTFPSRRFLFYEGVYGKHRFINPVRQKLNSLLLRFTKKKNSNIFLQGNLYDQVRIAYSVPRIIALISVREGENMNLFPTDLHGAVGGEYYVSSLRIGGNALEQVERLKKIVVSEISSAFFQLVYALGKNHMGEMKPISEFSIEKERSTNFNFPIPTGAGSYRELSLIDSFDAGIHRILIYKVIHQKKIKSIHTLAHIHQYYAQWRLNHNMKGEFLLR